MLADSTKAITHEEAMVISDEKSVSLPVNRFQPIIAPTMVCEVETGMPMRTINVIVKAAASATVKAPAKASTEPNLPSVPEGPLPSSTAPRVMNIAAMSAAFLNLSMWVSTAAPKMFPVSFAPSAQPRNSPLNR